MCLLLFATTRRIAASVANLVLGLLSGVAMGWAGLAKPRAPEFQPWISQITQTLYCRLHKIYK